MVDRWGRLFAGLGWDGDFVCVLCCVVLLLILEMRMCLCMCA